MATPHDPNKPNRGYFTHARLFQNRPDLPPGYTWEAQIEKYCPPGYLFRITMYEDEEQHISRKKDKFYRIGLDGAGKTRKDGSTFNRLSAVFCHRGLYDQALKIPENSSLAIDNGLALGLRLHELDVRLDSSKDPRTAFLAHDETGARVTDACSRWSRGNAADFINAILVTRGINVEFKDFASSFQETEARIPSLDLLTEYADGHNKDGNANPGDYTAHTFQLDLRGNDFATMLAWFRYKDFRAVQIILKGYNTHYSSGPELLRAVEESKALDTGTPSGTLHASEASFTSIAVGPWNKQTVTGLDDGTVRIWDSNTNDLVGTLGCHGGPITSVASSSIDPSTSWLQFEPLFQGRPVNCYRGTLVASGSLDKTVRIWDSQTGQLLHTLRCHTGTITSLSFAVTTGNPWIASGSDDRTVQICDAITGKLLVTLRGHTEPVTSVAFARNGEWIASGSLDKTVCIWESTTGKQLRTLRGHTGPITSVAFSVCVASGSCDNTVRIWDISTGATKHTLSGHTETVTSVAIDDFLGVAVSGSSDKTVKVWDLGTGTVRCTLEGYTNPIASIALKNMSAGGWQVMTTSSENTVRIWSFRYEEPDLGYKMPWSMRVVIVFFPQPIMNIAMNARGVTPNTRNILDLLDYSHLLRTARVHIETFLDISVPRFGQPIPEIVHSGLGLGYDTRTGKAVNPKNGTPISDPAVILESRLDRAMIEVALELRERFPRMMFSSCTRLSDVYATDGEYGARCATAKLYKKSDDEAGLQAKLRGLHGGLYPQSDVVVADDPFAEIAARTWIDEYGKLDRSELLRKPYDKWLAKKPEVKKAVDQINGRFWANTIDVAIGDSLDPAPTVPMGEPALGQAQTDDGKKRKWWNKR